ncbi:MAG TPA: hypothetical protein VHV81_06910 [Steroidobacteraceae bacterium]|jgi:O-antigen ligase|nr:hypothetical protein [Steroidobacteraceae bacterium]
MYRRDRWIALLLVGVLIVTLAIVFFAIGRLATVGVRAALAVAGALLVIFNAGSIRAMLKHNREDRTFIYTLDIKHLDEHRLARATRKDDP